MLNGTIDGVKFLAAYLKKENYCFYRPPMVMIEPTNICNINCTVCPQEKMSREKGYMPYDTFTNIIDNNFNFIQNLNLYLMGEPLLHPDILKMVFYARKFNVRTSIYTNATVLSEQLSEELIKSGLNVITFSFEGLGEHYEDIRRGSSYAEVMKNIRSFVSIRESFRKKRPCIIVKFINFNFDKREKETFIRSMRKVGVDAVWEVPLHGWPNIPEKYKKKSQAEHKNVKYYHCVLPWATLSVLWNGKVVGCCDDFNGNFVVGDINETASLYEIWNGHKMVSLRSKLVSREYMDLELCKNCERIWQPPFKYPIFQNLFWSVKEHFL